MAAWIKVGASIHNKPEVLGIAKECGLGVDTVVGKLIRMWAWFDEMSANGHVSYGTNVWLDSYVGHEGFAQACASVGWLRISSDGLTMPNFDRHNGESSKKRLTDAARKRKSRSNQVPESDKRPQNVREMSHEKCDQIREDKRREEVTTLAPRKRGGSPDEIEIPAELQAHETPIREWLAYKRERNQGYKPKGLNALWATCRKLGTGLPAAIEQSMANNYAGIYPAKDAPAALNKVSAKYQRGDDAYGD